MFGNYHLSLRDINTIYSNFVILEERELKDIDNRDAYALYLFLLMLKYKNLDLFNKIFIRHNVNVTNEQSLQQIQNSDFFDIDVIRKIKSNKKIHTMLAEKNLNIQSVDTKSKKYICRRDIYIEEFSYSQHTNLEGCIFYSDIENFENIEEMGIADYIHRKLELFDFEWNKSEKDGQE